MANVARTRPTVGKNQVPQGDQWMFDSQFKQPSTTVPYGLSFLKSTSTLFIQQEANVAQTITGLSSAQRFNVVNELGLLVLYVAENENDRLHRICCSANRGFILHVADPSNQEIMRITREFKCCGGCCKCCAGADCCAHEISIESPPGIVLGTVRQTRSCWRTHLSLRDTTGSEQLRVIGPCCICQGIFCCCCENKFKLMNANGNKEIGGIYKEYAGVVNQAVTGAEKYKINFPLEMPVHLKGIALATLFLINFMHFGGNAKTKGGCTLLSICC